MPLGAGDGSPPGGCLTLHPGRGQHLLLLGVSGAFVALTFLPDVEEADAVLRWGARGFFGLCAAIFALQLVPGASHLRLTAEGFEIRSLFRGGLIRWGDVEGFFPTRIGGSPFVGMRFRKDYDRAKAGRLVASALTGGTEGALPDGYGRKVDDLVALMEEWRRRHSVAG